MDRGGGGVAGLIRFIWILMREKPVKRAVQSIKLVRPPRPVTILCKNKCLIFQYRLGEMVTMLTPPMGARAGPSKGWNPRHAHARWAERHDLHLGCSLAYSWFWNLLAVKIIYWCILQVGCKQTDASCAACPS